MDSEPRIHHLGDITEWPPGPAYPLPDSEEPPAAPPAGSKRGLAAGAGFLLAGALVGVVGVSMLQGSSDDPVTPSSTIAQGAVPQGVAPLQDDAPDDGGFGGAGGLEGEQRLSGTVTAVGADSVTVRSAGGVATYAVTSSTQIRRNGAAAGLADLRSGDAVLVHVYPAGSSMVAERVLAGTSATDGGRGGPPPGDGDVGTTTRTT